MKQCYKLLLSLTAIALWATGCKETDEEALQDTLLVSTNSIAVAVEGGRQTIAVTSSGEWEATSPAKWITLTTAENQLTIVVDRNAGELRTGQIAIATATRQQTVTVQQESTVNSSALKVHYDKDKCTMDSEGATFTATVIAASEWTATISNENFTLLQDPAANRFTVSVPANQMQAQQTATVIVASAGVTVQIALIQQPRALNAYYSLVGTWAWTADKWYFNGTYPTQGTHAVLRLEEKEYNSTYTMWDLFIKGGGMYVTYFPDKREIHVPLGTSVGSNASYAFYLCACQIEGNKFGLSFEGEVAFTDEKAKMTVKGSNSNTYPYIGIFGYNGRDFIPASDLYYAQTEGSVLTREAASVAVVGSLRFVRITPNLGTIPRMRGYATAEME